MFYWIYTWLHETVPGVNVFKYISFRTAWAVITALVVSWFLFPPFIEWLRKKKMEQIIRTDGPESHLLAKVGTPTMGGLCLLLGVIVSTLLWARLDVPTTWMALIVTTGFGVIGFVDDWKKVMQRSADGLAGRWKIVGQVSIGGGVLAYGLFSGAIEPILPLPFLKTAVLDFRELWSGAPDLSALYVIFGLVVLVGASNAVNLTDGLDGLAIGPVITSSFTYGILAYVSGNVIAARYLDIHYVAGAGELTIFAMAIIGAGLGFLWYNAYPAQVFMGDVGSLALGGALGILAILTHHEFLLVLVGGIFVLEAVSVILQVGSFKLRGKRIFAMAPIHHHYEKQGWSETKIVVRFWIISMVLALVALSTLKLR